MKRDRTTQDMHPDKAVHTGYISLAELVYLSTQFNAFGLWGRNRVWLFRSWWL